MRPFRSPSAPSLTPAPEWSTSAWHGSVPLTLAGLRGRVVVLETFQMLCPGCVSHALPQAGRLVQTFGGDLTVIGLHSVFEHHQAMTDTSLEAFIHEYRLPFPVATDAHDEHGLIPQTFARYGMRGTPTTVLVDRAGMLRSQQFGTVDDMALAAAVTQLLAEDHPGDVALASSAGPAGACSVDGSCA